MKFKKRSLAKTFKKYELSAVCATAFNGLKAVAQTAESSYFFKVLARDHFLNFIILNMSHFSGSLKEATV